MIWLIISKSASHYIVCLRNCPPVPKKGTTHAVPFFLVSGTPGLRCGSRRALHRGGNALKHDRWNIEPAIFWPTILIFAAVSVGLFVGGDTLFTVLSSLLQTLTTRLGWVYLWIYIINFIFLGWLAFSKYGNIKFGAPDKKPEYSNFSWTCMVFTTGIDASIMIMSLFEPIQYVSAPPFGLEPFSAEAYDYAHMYGQFHWGPSAWTMYIPATIAIAYTLFVKRTDTTRISNACVPASGWLERHLWARHLLDVIIVFGIMGGYALYVQRTGIVDLAGILATEGQEAAITALLSTLPLPQLMLVVYLISCFVFLATTISSSAYILSSMTSKKLSGYENPARWNRLLWSVVFMLFSAGIMVVGGMETIKLVCVLAGFPLIAVVLLLMRSIRRMVKTHADPSFPSASRSEPNALTAEHTSS